MEQDKVSERNQTIVEQIVAGRSPTSVAREHEISATRAGQIFARRVMWAMDANPWMELPSPWPWRDGYLIVGRRYGELVVNGPRNATEAARLRSWVVDTEISLGRLSL